MVVWGTSRTLRWFLSISGFYTTVYVIMVVISVWRTWKKKREKCFLRELYDEFKRNKQTYFAVALHILDQASDIEACAEYDRQRRKQPGFNDELDLNPEWWFTMSVSILVVHRVVSTMVIWRNTRNLVNTALQSLDLAMVRAVLDGLQQRRDEPGNVERMLQSTEAIFESFPQLVLSLVYLLRTKQANPAIVIQALFSIFNLGMRICNDDAIFFPIEWKKAHFKPKCPPKMNALWAARVFLFRVPEVFQRVIVISLFWALVGGDWLCLLICVDFIICKYVSNVLDGWDPRSSLDQRWGFADYFSVLLYYKPGIDHVFVWFMVRPLLCVIYTSIAIINASSAHNSRMHIVRSPLGSTFCIATGLACLAPTAFYFYLDSIGLDFTKLGFFSNVSKRDLQTAIQKLRFDDVFEMVRFGADPLLVLEFTTENTLLSILFRGQSSLLELFSHYNPDRSVFDCSAFIFQSDTNSQAYRFAGVAKVFSVLFHHYQSKDISEARLSVCDGFVSLNQADSELFGITNNEITSVRKFMSDMRAKMDERDENGNPMFIVKLFEFNDSQNILDLFAAKLLYVLRRAVLASDHYNDTHSNKVPNCLSALHVCAIYPRLSLVLRRFLKEGTIDPNLSDSFGNPPLYLAAMNGNNVGVLELMKDPRVQIDRANKHGCTALMIACLNNHFAVVSTLLSGHANQYRESIFNHSALDYAKCEGNFKVAKLLDQSVSASTDIFEEIAWMIVEGCPVICDRYSPSAALLKLMKYFPLSSDPLPTNHTALHLFALHRRLRDMLNSRLESGTMDVDCRDANGRTPLMWAAMNGNISAVALLLQHDCYKKIRDKDGKTALDHAIDTQNEKVISLLDEEEDDHGERVYQFLKAIEKDGRKVFSDVLPWIGDSRQYYRSWANFVRYTVELWRKHGSIEEESSNNDVRREYGFLDDLLSLQRGQNPRLKHVSFEQLRDARMLTRDFICEMMRENGWEYGQKKNKRGHCLFMIKLLHYSHSKNIFDAELSKCLYTQRGVIAADSSIPLGKWSHLHGMLEWFLKDGNINPNQRDRFGNTPLYHAAMNGNERAVQTLLRDSRVDAHLANQHGCTALMIASLNNQNAVVSMLNRSNARNNQASVDRKKAIDFALLESNVAVARMLGERHSMHKHDNSHQTLRDVAWMIIEGCPAISESYRPSWRIQRLLNAFPFTDDIDYTLERNDLDEPMFIVKLKHFARSEDENDLLHARYLYVHRRRVRAASSDLNGRNALHVCAQHASLNGFLEYLLKDGQINPNQSDRNREVPLTFAMRAKNKAGVDLFLNDDRIDINSRSGRARKTILIHAVELNQATIVFDLLQRGCNQKIKDTFGKTAMDYSRDPAMTDLLGFENLAEQHPFGDKGQSALHICAQYPKLGGVVGLLLRDGQLDPNEKDHLHMTPMMYAAGFSNFHALGLLKTDLRLDMDIDDPLSGNSLMIVGVALESERHEYSQIADGEMLLRRLTTLDYVFKRNRHD